MHIAATFMLVFLLACFTAQAGDQPSLDELRAMASRDDPWAWKALGVNHDLNGEVDAAFTHFGHAANRGNGRGQQFPPTLTAVVVAPTEAHSWRHSGTSFRFTCVALRDFLPKRMAFGTSCPTKLGGMPRARLSMPQS